MQACPLYPRSPELLSGHLLSQAVLEFAVSDKVLLPGRLLPEANSFTLPASIERLVQVRGIATLYLAETGNMHRPGGLKTWFWFCGIRPVRPPQGSEDSSVG